MQGSTDGFARMDEKAAAGSHCLLCVRYPDVDDKMHEEKQQQQYGSRNVSELGMRHAGKRIIDFRSLTLFYKAARCKTDAQADTRYGISLSFSAEITSHMDTDSASEQRECVQILTCFETRMLLESLSGRGVDM
jgi:hypothetical protein